jgi:hypothetical protein
MDPLEPPVTLAVPPNLPLVGVLREEDSHPIVHYFADVGASAQPSGDETLRAALSVIGAWSDLDWDEFSIELDRIRHGSWTMPPIQA